MTNDLFYAAEKYLQALEALATGDGVLRERLITACMCNILAHRETPPRPGLGPKMDPALLNRIYDFTERVTCRPAVSNEGTITATINAMTASELRDTAQELFSLALAVNEALDRTEPAGTR